MPDFDIKDLLLQAMENFQCSERLIQVGEHIKMCTLAYEKEHFNFFSVEQKCILENNFQKSTPLLFEIIGLPKNTTSVSLYFIKTTLSNEETKMLNEYTNDLENCVFFTYSENKIPILDNDIIQIIFYHDKLNIDYSTQKINKTLKNFLLINETEESKKLITLDSLTDKFLFIL